MKTGTTKGFAGEHSYRDAATRLRVSEEDLLQTMLRCGLVDEQGEPTAKAETRGYLMEQALTPRGLGYLSIACRRSVRILLVSA